jgi:hypothetical protein
MLDDAGGTIIFHEIMRGVVSECYEGNQGWQHVDIGQR